MPRALTALPRRAAAQLLRLIPGSAALRLKRDLRDAAWLKEADAVVISFPKSGRTFVRAMLARLYEPALRDRRTRAPGIPRLAKGRANVPRLLFTHAGDAMRSPDDIGLDPKDYAGKKWF